MIVVGTRIQHTLCHNCQ